MTDSKRVGPQQAWHFREHREHLRDGTPVVDGAWLRYDDDVQICETGLHASRRVIDALYYATGPWVSLCEVDDIVDEHPDKLVCRSRRHLWTVDATDTLRLFARWCALSVIDYWDPPDCVRTYLETGAETLRDLARASTEAITMFVDDGRVARFAAVAAYWCAAEATAMHTIWATRLIPLSVIGGIKANLVAEDIVSFTAVYAAKFASMFTVWASAARRHAPITDASTGPNAELDRMLRELAP